MRKITEKQIETLAQEALSRGNPYIARSVPYYIDRVEVYLDPNDGKTHTKEEMDEMYLGTARKDIKCGYDDRSVGYYDKWYRYNHFDEGRAYDRGQREAARTPGCRDDLQFIEVIEATGPKPERMMTRAERNRGKDPYRIEEEKER